MNKVILTGNLGADPEVRFTPSGQAVCNFRMATSEKWKDKDGKRQERTEWHRIVVWGKLAELQGEWVKKGTKLTVVGKLQTREWTDKENRKNYTTEIVASEIEWISGTKSKEDADNTNPPRASGRSGVQSGEMDYGNPPANERDDNPPPMDDDIPF